MINDLHDRTKTRRNDGDLPRRPLRSREEAEAGDCL